VVTGYSGERADRAGTKTRTEQMHRTLQLENLGLAHRANQIGGLSATAPDAF
jgi:hypothetical protein